MTPGGPRAATGTVDGMLRPLRRPLLLAVLATALVLGGCDDGGTPEDATRPGPESTSPVPAAPPEPTSPSPAPPAVDGEFDTVTYVALGDSLATGAGATTSYVEVYADGVEARTGVEVAITNLAVNGWTSTDLLDALRQDETMRTAVAGADLVTVDIGANDLLRAIPVYASEQCGGDDNLQCLREATALVEVQWAAILDEILDLRDGDTTGIATIDLYQPFVGNPRVADDLDALRPVMAELNAVLTSGAEARGIPVARVHTAFHGPDGTDDPTEAFLISVDGLHPSNAGHAVIAQELLALDVDWAHAGPG